MLAALMILLENSSPVEVKSTGGDSSVDDQVVIKITAEVMVEVSLTASVIEVS